MSSSGPGQIKVSCQVAQVRVRISCKIRGGQGIQGGHQDQGVLKGVQKCQMKSGGQVRHEVVWTSKCTSDKGLGNKEAQWTLLLTYLLETEDSKHACLEGNPTEIKVLRRDLIKQ